MPLIDQAIVAIRKLPAHEQELLAREVLDRIGADERWDSLFADPRSPVLLRKLAAEARAEVARGEFREGDPSDLDDQ